MARKDLFANSSSSNDDDDQEDEELAQQMVTAAMRERRRDPHAYTPFSGKKKMSFVGTTTQKARSDSESTDSSGSGDGDTWKEEQRPIFQADVESMRKIKKSKRNGINNTTADGDDGGIRINQQYAAKYEEVKRRKEIQQLTEKYGKRLRLNGGEEDEDEDEEDEEDDEAVLLTEEKELAFARAFLAIRQSAVKQVGKQKHGDDEKGIDASSTHVDGNRNAEDGADDPLGPQNVFFPPTEEQIRENTKIFTRSIAKKRQQRKKFTLADEYRRGVVTGVETHASGHESNDDDEGRHQPQESRRIQPRTAKERALRESFLKSVAESTETFDVQLVDAAMQTGEREAEHTNSSKARRLLQGAFSIREADKSDPANEDPDEAFLREFFVEELWKPENNKKRKQKVLNRGNYENGSHAEAEVEEEEQEEEEEEENNYAALAELAQAEEDERFYAEAELWERAYQDRAYRHQEEEADHVQTFPRAIGEHAAGIMRKSVKSSRKDVRMRRLERIKELREQQLAELRRLKTLKRQEIESQRALIASIAGIRGNQGSDICNKKEKKKLRGNEDQDEEAAMARLRELWSEKDLEEEFDPQKFDKKMAQIFDDAYYDDNNVDEEEMAFFEEGEEEVGTMKDGDDDDDGRGKDDAGGERGGEEEEVEEEAEPGWYKAKSLEEAVAMTRKKTLNRKPNKHDGIHVVDDALALLYPSVSLQAAETASFSGRREHIEHMIRENKKKKGEKGHETDGKKEETLRQLREDLERKEKEYWQLHHDSTLDQGAIKTRFKYRQVAPEDFTLTVEEILSRDDRQLNMLVPMSCYAAYLQEDANRRDRLKIERRRQRGFREVDPTRSSRRYGDVSKTALVDVNMTEEEGEKWSKEVRGGLRRLRESVTLEEGADMTGVDGSGRGKGATTSQKLPPPPQQQQQQQQQQQGGTHHSKKARYEREEGGGQTRQYLHYQQHQGQHTQEREGMRRGGGRGRTTKGGGALHIARGNGSPVRMRERN
ncbi:protein KRI1 [Trypanosoma cruzi]|nr:protein KRI1 [Trypanosoma cruzi]